MKFLALVFLLLGCVTAETPAPTNVQSPVDPSVRHNKTPQEESLSIKNESCEIRFLIESASTPPKKSLRIDDDCDASHKERYAQYLKILESILALYPKDQFVRVSSHSFYHLQIWDEEIALAMANSPTWQSFEKKRQRGETPNKVFVEIFNDSHLGTELINTFDKVGLKIRLERVEKVMESKAKDMPFAQKYDKLMALEKRIPFSAGVFFFQVKN